MVARENVKKGGFTIVELLTVMTVIAILITLLVPALGLVKDFAKEIQQRAQFHSIEVGLELFKSEFGSYPESNENLYNDNVPSGVAYSGANKLAEAMVGLDMLGYHPNSAFRADGDNIRDDGAGNGGTETYPVYHATFDDDGNTAAGNVGRFAETADENVAARIMHLELENANAFDMQDVYEDVDMYMDGQVGVSEIERSIVLCDEYTAKRHTKKTGMPILYYRARTMFTQQDYTDTNGGDDDVYNYDDNVEILSLGLPEDQNIDHTLSNGTDDYQDFENMILNTQVSSLKRPYRADSYILISAGKDGMYGSPDDVFNFEKE